MRGNLLQLICLLRTKAFGIALSASMLAALLFFVSHAPASARGGYRSSHASYSFRVKRFNQERRSKAEKEQFERMTGHPNGWPGHVVDHIVPLACGGADSPSNMQWQTIAEGKAKDKWERKGCHK